MCIVLCLDQFYISYASPWAMLYKLAGELPILATREEKITSQFWI